VLLHEGHDIDPLGMGVVEGMLRQRSERVPLQRLFDQIVKKRSPVLLGAAWKVRSPASAPVPSEPKAAGNTRKTVAPPISKPLQARATQG